MRNKFKIILSDGSKYKAPKDNMIIMNSSGVVFLAKDCGYSGWYIRRLSEVLDSYTVVMEDQVKVKIIDISGSHCFDKGSVVDIELEKDGEFEATGISRYTGNKITQWLIKEEFEIISE